MKLEDYFFVIDSDHLDQVSSQLYGYCLTEQGIVSFEDSIHPEHISATGLGSYDLIVRSGNIITIRQDALGSQGVYLYQDADYFAISNSNLFLMEYLKADGRHTLSLNKDFAFHLIPLAVGNFSGSSTIINEIHYLARDTKIIIEIKERKIYFEHMDWKEDTIPVDTEEGMALLDDWMERWCSIIRNLYVSGANIEFDLSGGFDSRLSMLVGINSGIDMNGVVVRSLNDGLICHDEDYRIASQIAHIYGFELNREDVFSFHDTPLSIPEILSISMYTKGLSHKQMYYKLVRHSVPKYRVTGGMGENRRRDKKHHHPEEVLVSGERQAAHFFSETLLDEALTAERKIIQKSVDESRRAIREREDIDEELPRRLWMDSRWRSHFGKDMFECLPANEIKLLPLADPQLMKLKRYGKRGDADLLIALIFMRYGKEIIDIPFEGGRTIKEETIDYARELCEFYPWKKPQFNISRSEKKARSQYENRTGQSAYSEEEAIHFARLLAADPCIRNHFCSVFDEETYFILTKDSYVRKFRPLQMLNGVLAVGIADLCVHESQSGDPIVFTERIEKLDLNGYVNLTEEMLRNSIEKESNIASLQKELNDIYHSRKYKLVCFFARILKSPTRIFAFFHNH